MNSRFPIFLLTGLTIVSPLPRVPLSRKDVKISVRTCQWRESGSEIRITLATRISPIPAI